LSDFVCACGSACAGGSDFIQRLGDFVDVRRALYTGFNFDLNEVVTHDDFACIALAGGGVLPGRRAGVLACAAVGGRAVVTGKWDQGPVTLP